LTNPPYMLANEFVAHALELCPNVIMLLRLAFLESERRSPILDGAGLKRILAFRKRLPMMHRDGWEGRKANSGMAFAWLVWQRGYSGDPSLQRISWEDDRDAPPILRSQGRPLNGSQLRSHKIKRGGARPSWRAFYPFGRGAAKPLACASTSTKSGSLEDSMIVGRSIRKAIDDWEQGELESAMLHACNAVDGTAGKLYPTSKNKERFTRTLRENYGFSGQWVRLELIWSKHAFLSLLKGPRLRTESLISLTCSMASTAAAMRMGMNFQMVLDFCKMLVDRSVSRACWSSAAKSA
jgi:hypothetical protein